MMLCEIHFGIKNLGATSAILKLLKYCNETSVETPSLFVVLCLSYN